MTLLWLLAVSLAAGPVDPPAAYVAEIRQYREEREQRLRSEYGWLTLAGLHWLDPGEHAFGRDPANTIVLPGAATPARAGTLLYDGRTVRVRPAPGSGLTLNGKPLAAEQLLRDDSQGEADLLRLGPVQLYVIVRGGRHAVRVKDPDSPARKEFRGLEYFPIDPGYRVEATFRAWPEPRKVEMATVLGTTEKMLSPGWLDFSLGGSRFTLQAFREQPADQDLFLVFRDETSGGESYGAGRYLSATLRDGKAVVDFNRAYNPPCAFTTHATCPLPPPGNRLPVRIEAGERSYSH